MYARLKYLDFEILKKIKKMEDARNKVELSIKNQIYKKNSQLQKKIVDELNHMKNIEQVKKIIDP